MGDRFTTAIVIVFVASLTIWFTKNAIILFWASSPFITVVLVLMLVFVLLGEIHRRKK